MVPLLTSEDIDLIVSLVSRKYSDNKMLSAASLIERESFFAIKHKLKKIAENYKAKYDSFYGPFSLSISSGNPIAIGGSRLNRPWSGVYKGAANKQYAAQVSFVINMDKGCLDVGFYFGRAAGHSIKSDKKREAEEGLRIISNRIVDEIQNDPELRTRYDQLFEYGFRASTEAGVVTPEAWLNAVRTKPEKSQITFSIHPNDEGYIDPALTDLAVAMIICLMSPVPDLSGNVTPVSGSPDNTVPVRRHNYKPLTPGQRAKQAERRTLIGESGEKFALEYERARIKNMDTDHRKYPDHVALKSMTYGFDILSSENKKDELYIEVKTTTRLKSDPTSAIFFISSEEYQYYLDNKERYRLYRVYDIEGSPVLEIVDMAVIEIQPNGYVGTIKNI
jgi:hypothetical protein